MKIGKNCALIFAGLLSVMICKAELPAQVDKENFIESDSLQTDTCTTDHSSLGKTVLKGVVIYGAVVSVVFVSVAAIVGLSIYNQIKSDSNQRRR